MSGSGSGGGFESGGAGSRSPNCSTLAFETYINSPVPEELLELSVGDTLLVDLIVVRGVEVIRVTKQGNLVVGLVEHSMRIKQCLERGFNYEAFVQTILGAAVKVYVKAKG